MIDRSRKEAMHPRNRFRSGYDFKQLAVAVFAHRVVASARHASLQKKSETTEACLREIVDSVRVPL